MAAPRVTIIRRPRWQPGEALFGVYPLPADLAPGDYTLTVALYDDADPSGLDIMDIADNPAGKRVRLGPVRVICCRGFCQSQPYRLLGMTVREES